MRQDEAQKTDDLLAAAGFKVRPADTPEKLAHLKAMQPLLKVSMRTKDGRVIYSYADPYNCQCVYVGGPEEFAQYQRLALRQQVAEERLEAAEMANDEAMDWEMWGPYWW